MPTMDTTNAAGCERAIGEAADAYATLRRKRPTRSQCTQFGAGLQSERERGKLGLG